MSRAAYIPDVFNSGAFLFPQPEPGVVAWSEFMTEEESNALSYWNVSGDFTTRTSGGRAYISPLSTSGSKYLTKTFNFEPGSVSRWALELDAISHDNAVFFIRVNFYSAGNFAGRLEMGSYSDLDGVRCPNNWLKLRREVESPDAGIDSATVWINCDRNNLDTSSKAFGVRDVRLEYV